MRRLRAMYSLCRMGWMRIESEEYMDSVSGSGQSGECVECKQNILDDSLGSRVSVRLAGPDGVGLSSCMLDGFDLDIR